MKNAKYKAIVLNAVILIIIFVVEFSRAAIANEAGGMDLFFYSPQAKQAHLTFDFQVTFESEHKPSEEAIFDAVDRQLKFTVGSLRARLALPKISHRIQILDLVKAEDKNWTVKYRYDNTIIMNDTITTPTLDIAIPFNPETIWDAGIVKNGDQYLFPCTNPHYHEKEDFWYYWGPFNANCPLKQGVDFDVVIGKYTLESSTQNSYPEYANLVVQTKEGPVLPIHLLVGMNSYVKPENPFNTDDLFGKEYLKIRDSLLAKGFVAKKLVEDPFEEELVLQTQNAKIIIHGFFGQTGIFLPSEPFHKALKEGLEKSSLVLYNGHSGLGWNLSLKHIEWLLSSSIQPPKDRYQIYFFNGCVTYTYYLEQYFAKKITDQDPLGTKYLDILTTGKAIGSNTYPEATMGLLNTVIDWANGGTPTSYPELLKKMEVGNMVNVSGDEDNAPNAF